MAAVELPLSLSTANSLYRQSSADPLYRQTATDSLYRQSSEHLGLDSLKGSKPSFCALAATVVQAQAGLGQATTTTTNSTALTTTTTTTGLSLSRDALTLSRECPPPMDLTPDSPPGFDTTMEYATADAIAMPPTLFHPQTAWAVATSPATSKPPKAAPRKIRNPKLKLKITPLRQLSLAQQWDDVAAATTPTTPLGPICESPTPSSLGPFHAHQHRHNSHVNNNNVNASTNCGRSRVSALFHASRAATPPKSAPPTVASTPIDFGAPWFEKRATAIETQTASRVLPGVFLGSENDAADLEYLKSANITHVLNVSTHIPCFHEEASTSRDGDGAAFDAILNEEINKRESALTATTTPTPAPWRLKYKRLAASDNASQNLAQYFLEAFCFIDEALRLGTGVLIHCQAGISRSSTILIAFIMSRSSLSMFQAYRFVKEKRAIISPNLNFMGQLLEFEQKLSRGEIERRPAREALGAELAEFVAKETEVDEEDRCESM